MQTRSNNLACELTDEIIRSRLRRREAASAFNETSYVDQHVERVRAALANARADIVGDFRFGVVEGKQMVAGPVQNVVTIQNVSDSIISVVQSGHLASSYQELGRQLADVLKSDEVQGLAAADQDEVTAPRVGLANGAASR